jgi:predicted transcriptional regulator
MSAVEIIEQIKNLPVAERAQVARFIVEQDDSWIPDEFRQAMADADAGRFVEMDTVLRKTPPEALLHCIP